MTLFHTPIQSCLTALSLTMLLTGAGIAGDLDETETAEILNADPVLVEFLIENPEHPLHHWSKGDVWTGEEFLPYHRILEQGNRVHEVYRYREERAKREDTFRDNLFLADGCREHELWAEERAHLVRCLLADYSFHEAHRRLGHVNRNGFWITPEQIRRMYVDVLSTRRNLAKWSEKVQRLQARFSKTRPDSKGEEKVLQQVYEIRTPEAIPAFERYFASAGKRETIAFQKWLSEIDSYQAAEALARQAIFCSKGGLRTHASKQLRSRALGEYVPYLMDGLQTVKTRYSYEILSQRFRRVEVPSREISKQQIVDGLNTTLKVSTDVEVFNEEDFVTAPWNAWNVTQVWISWGEPPQSREYARNLLNSAEVRLGDAILANFGEQASESTQSVRNDRVMRCLMSATETAEKSREEWFDWWRGHNELVFDNGKLQLQDQYNEGPWYVSRRNQTARRASRIQVAGGGSCFVKGTSVETEQGQRPIEAIQVGDCVLSQDIETGELTFKPVFDRPKREDAPTVVIDLGVEQFHCSLGHPFWVSGLGWRMAKELEVGMPLVTMDGKQAEIQQITPAEKETVYNLVVADFSTYFAGKNRFLTHDVTLREPTDMVYPGIRRKFE